MAIIENEGEAFNLISTMLTSKLRKHSPEEIETSTLENLIRLFAQQILKELCENDLLPNDTRVPVESLAKLIDIKIEDNCSPKINLWPLIALLYPTVKIKFAEMFDQLNLQSGTLDEPINGGRYIDLS